MAKLSLANAVRRFDSVEVIHGIAVGVVANRAIASGVPVGIAEVLGAAFARPDYAVGAAERNAPINIAHYPFLAGAAAIDEGLV